MFFSTYVLTKKGPLAKVWLAAHWDKRLTRHEVKVVDLSQTILHIVRPVVPIALRTSGELLVGVVRIYALKVKHLLKEATEATLVLRVTTLAAKGSATSTSATRAGLSAQQQQQRTTTIDGILVPHKGDVEAVTFDWSTELAAKHGSAKEAADALGEGRFDAIADLLGSGRRIEGPDTEKEDGLLASAWYTVQPTSQVAEELHNTQQDYDEIAKMRADLMAFGERASGSVSTSKSKSSLSSTEKARGSAALMDANGVPFLPPMADELDIGMPLPDELPLGFAGEGGDGMPADPFFLPDVMTADDAAPGRVPPRASRKPRPVNILDLASTTLSREAFEKWMADRSDTLNVEPRRGPYDAQEEADRFLISGSTHPSSAAAMPLSGVLNPLLREVYAAALRQSVEEEAAADEAARAAQRPSTTMATAASRRSAGAMDDDFAHGAAALPEEAAVPAEDEEGLAQLQPQPSNRKRGRDEDGDDTAGLSVSAQQTLERICGTLSRHASAAAANNRKKARLDTSPPALVGNTCTVDEVCQGLRRRDAARTFVDVLALASKQYVAADQLASLGDIHVKLNATAVPLLSAA